MSTDIKKAEETAVNAAKAITRLFNFAYEALRELARTVASTNGYRMLRTDPARVSTPDLYIVKRYTGGEDRGDLWLKRFYFAPFVMPQAKVDEAGGGRILPFLMVSLLNTEERAPSVVYGLLRDCEGRDRHEEIFLEFFLFWLNEELAATKKEAKRFHKGYSIEKVVLARAETRDLYARVIFNEMPLLDIDASNLVERGEQMAAFIAESALASAK